MKKYLPLIVILLLTTGVKAQDDADTAWKVSADVSLMLSQSSFTNWAPGGENNFTLNGFINSYAGYIKGRTKWETLLGLAYGQSKTGDRGYRKSEDKIDLQSTYGLKASEKWYYTVNFNFKSQFDEGFDYHDDVDSIPPEKISNFLAPAFVSLGIGGEYRPKSYMSLYLSPATMRWIIVNDQDLADAGKFGVEKAKLDADGNVIPGTGENTKFEFGAYVRFLFVKDVMKNVSLNTKLELYSDYLGNPENIDINWDTQINLKVNNWLSAMFGVVVVYDDDTPITDKNGLTGPRTQVKQLLSVGLSHKFNNR